MADAIFESARRIRDSNTVLVVIFLAIILAFGPFVALVTSELSNPSEPMLARSWWIGTIVLVGYGMVHVLAAFADTKQFLADYGTQYASAVVVFCHALGQRLLVLVAVGFAVVLIAILGTGAGAPAALLITVGLFGAFLLAPPTAIPMNRRVSERLSEYRQG